MFGASSGQIKWKTCKPSSTILVSSLASTEVQSGTPKHSSREVVIESFEETLLQPDTNISVIKKGINKSVTRLIIPSMPLYIKYTVERK
jgi:hypothetical protein